MIVWDRLWVMGRASEARSSDDAVFAGSDKRMSLGRSGLKYTVTVCPTSNPSGPTVSS